MEYPPTFLRDGDVITHGFNAELDEYRALRDNNSGSYIMEYEAAEKVRTDIPNLRIEYNGKLGYFIEVTKAQLSKVPEDYLRVQTLKGTERFTTQELREYQEKHIVADEKKQISPTVSLYRAGWIHQAIYPVFCFYRRKPSVFLMFYCLWPFMPIYAVGSNRPLQNIRNWA